VKTSKPMTMAEAARYLRDGGFGFGTLRSATAFLRWVRDRGHGDSRSYSVDYTAQRRFIVMEDDPGCTCPSCTANRPAPARPGWEMWAHDRGGGRYDNPGEQWWTELHGLPYPVVPVLVTEVAGDDPGATHWGWIDSRESTSRLAGVPVMIWASKAAFDAQFPYGALAEVEAGKGQIVRLRITAREIPPA
jgi:hypothetical protein